MLVTYGNIQNQTGVYSMTVNISVTSLTSDKETDQRWIVNS